MSGYIVLGHGHHYMGEYFEVSGRDGGPIFKADWIHFRRIDKLKFRVLAKECTLEFFEDQLLYYDGIYYGEMEVVFDPNRRTLRYWKSYNRIQEFEESLSHIPPHVIPAYKRIRKLEVISPVPILETRSIQI